MGAPFNDVFSKAEEAAKSVVDDLSLSGVTVNTGIDEDELAAPYVVLFASSSGDEVVRSTGIISLTLDVTVASLADAHDLDSHRARVAEVFDSFLDSGIAVTLSSAIDDFHCYEAVETGRAADTDDRKLTNTLSLDLVCCGSSIS